MNYQWNFEKVIAYWPALLDGLLVTVAMSIAGFLCSATFGLVVVFARLSPNRLLSGIAAAYTTFFRGTPFLVQLLWLYYTLPIMTGIAFDSVTTATIGITLNLGAFIAETYRAGITSIEAGQRNAALALGMTRTQMMIRIVLPQAIVRVIPPLSSYWVSTFKDTSLFSLISVYELTYQSRLIVSDTYRPLEMYTLLALIYFAVTYPQARFVDYLFEKFRVRN